MARLQKRETRNSYYPGREALDMAPVDNRVPKISNLQSYSPGLDYLIRQCRRAETERCLYGRS
jgi:hypothetical protein